jgi:succinate dehydrogenase/fumarate reductase cytochrome b subunit
MADDRWRRWHRWTGAGFLALFLVGHLVTNASVLAGSVAYDRVVVSLQRSAIFPVLEVLVLVPLALHGGMGLSFLLRRRGTPDAVIERYGERRLWTLQRVAAVPLFVFLVVHLAELRVARLGFGLRPEAFSTVLAAHLSSTWAGVPWFALLYLLGIAAAALHLANGLFSATSAWRASADPGGRRRVRIVTAALGVGLFLLGSATVLGFATGLRLLPPPPEAGLPCSPGGPTIPPIQAPAPKTSSR